MFNGHLHVILQRKKNVISIIIVFISSTRANQFIVLLVYYSIHIKKKKRKNPIEKISFTNKIHAVRVKLFSTFEKKKKNELIDVI